jgi:hypothetical protein
MLRRADIARHRRSRSARLRAGGGVGRPATRYGSTSSANAVAADAASRVPASADRRARTLAERIGHLGQPHDTGAPAALAARRPLIVPSSAWSAGSGDQRRRTGSSSH